MFRHRGIHLCFSSSWRCPWYGRLAGGVLVPLAGGVLLLCCPGELGKVKLLLIASFATFPVDRTAGVVVVGGLQGSVAILPALAAGVCNPIVEVRQPFLYPAAARIEAVAKVGVVVTCGCPLVARGRLVDPTHSLAHVGVDTGDAVLSAPDAPCNDADLVVGVGLAWSRADQRAAAVTAACVLALLAASAQEGVVQPKATA